MVVLRAALTLENAILSINCQSLQPYLLELPKCHQLLELTFLLTVASKVSKILLTVRVEISVYRSFQSDQTSVNSGHLHSFQS